MDDMMKDGPPSYQLYEFGSRTMMVCLKDGKLISREVDYVDCSSQSGPRKTVPKLLDGEQLVWMIGRNTPTIVDVGRRSPTMPESDLRFWFPKEGS